MKNKNSKYIPVAAPNLKGNELKYVTECIKTEWISSSGRFVPLFEKKFAQFAIYSAQQVGRVDFQWELKRIIFIVFLNLK